MRRSTPLEQCPDEDPHDEHEWYQGNALRRSCVGVDPPRVPLWQTHHECRDGHCPPPEAP